MKKLYTDRVWLEHQYLYLRKSPYRIAREFSCSTDTINRWLKYFNFLIRSRSEAALLRSNHVTLSPYGLEFLTGLLLGDGSLDSYNKHSASYCHSAKYQGDLQWLSGRLKDYRINQCGKINVRSGFIPFPGGKIWTTFYFYGSLHYIELKDLWRKWYRPATEKERKIRPRRKFIKIIPLDLELTPLTCSMWYLGDGYLGHQRKSRWITLCTQGFEREEVEFLSNLLTKLGFMTTTCKNNTINLRATSTEDFLKYIGPCPNEVKEVYGYKWE